MTPETKADWDDLAKRGIILTEDKQKELMSQGYKTAILSGNNGEVIIILNPQAIDNFVAEAPKISGWKDFNPADFYYLPQYILEDQVVFVETDDKTELPTLCDARSKLSQHPYLTRTQKHLDKLVLAKE